MIVVNKFQLWLAGRLTDRRTDRLAGSLRLRHDRRSIGAAAAARSTICWPPVCWLRRSKANRPMKLPQPPQLLCPCGSAGAAKFGLPISQPIGSCSSSHKVRVSTDASQTAAIEFVGGGRAVRCYCAGQRVRCRLRRTRRRRRRPHGSLCQILASAGPPNIANLRSRELEATAWVGTFSSQLNWLPSSSSPSRNAPAPLSAGGFSRRLTICRLLLFIIKQNEHHLGEPMCLFHARASG